MAKENITFSIEESKKNKLEKISDKEKRSLASQVELIVEEWLDKNEK